MGLIGFTFICALFLFPETRYSRLFVPLPNNASPNTEKIEESIKRTDDSSVASHDNPDVIGHVPSDPWLGRGKPSKQQWKLAQPYEGNILKEIWVPWKLFTFPIVEFAAFVVSVRILSQHPFADANILRCISDAFITLFCIKASLRTKSLPVVGFRVPNCQSHSIASFRGTAIQLLVIENWTLQPCSSNRHVHRLVHCGSTK